MPHCPGREHEPFVDACCNGVLFKHCAGEYCAIELWFWLSYTEFALSCTIFVDIAFFYTDNYGSLYSSVAVLFMVIGIV